MDINIYNNAKNKKLSWQIILAKTFQDEMIEQLVKIKLTLAEQEKSIREINNTLNHISTYLDQHQPSSTTKTSVESENLLSLLPLSSEEDIAKIEEILNSNKDAAAILVIIVIFYLVSCAVIY